MKQVATNGRREIETGVEQVDSRDQTIQTVVGIPAYNEEIGIGSVVVAASAHVDGVVVVDDGSTDRTAEIARKAGASVISHESNRGKGAAIRSILAFARDVDAEALAILDGDGQHLPEQIPTVMGPVLDNRADLVIGNRHDGATSATETPLYRRIGQRSLDRFTQLSTGASVRDTQSGFRAFSPEAIESIALATDGMGVESEMIHAAVTNDLRIDEVPIDVRYEGIDGQTHNAFYHGLVVGIRILTLSHRRILASVGLFTLLGIGFRRIAGTRDSQSESANSSRSEVLLGLGGGIVVTVAASHLRNKARGKNE